MATQKFTNFGKFFLMHTDRTAVTIQTNKLFQMKLKTSKHYWNHLTEKNKQPFWPTQYNTCMWQSLETRAHTSLAIRIYILERKYTQMAGLTPSLCLLEPNRILTREKPYNGIECDSFIKNVQLCGHNRIHVRWEPYKCLKTFSNDLDIPKNSY